MEIYTEKKVRGKPLGDLKWEKLKKKALEKGGDLYALAGYSDYGGTVFDKVFIEACKRLGLNEHIVPVDYFGQVALIPITEEEEEDLANEIQGEFRGIELFYIYNEMIEKAIDEVVKEEKEYWPEWDEEKIREFMYENAGFETSGMDYSSEALEIYMEKE